MNKPAIHYSLVIDSPLGRLGALVVNQRLHRLDYLDDSMRLNPPDTAFAARLQQQLQDYFDNPVTAFSVPFTLDGTAFQQRVWKALTMIPPGETCTYGELAGRLCSGARAVGNACRHNPVSIIVPCHRVVAANGLGGYSGHTGGPLLARKAWLLDHENPHVPALKNPILAPDKQVHP